MKPYYEAYQNIEFAAVPSIPIHWGVKKFRHIARLVQRKNRDEVVRPMLSLSAYRGIEIKQYDDESLSRTKEEALEYLVVEPNQLVVNPMWVIYGAIGVSKYRGIVSPAYRVYRLSDDIFPAYCDYLLKSHFYVNDYNRYIRGLTTYDRSVRKEDFHEISVLLPPREEQDAIVTFLDHKLAEIDRFIANKERLITLLKEQKAAIINHAVTRGIEPDVPMKPSGIEWLGEIPAHWEIVKLRRLAESLQTGPFGSQLHQSDYIHGGTPIINPSHMRDLKIVPDYECTVSQKDWEKLKRHALIRNDILFARRGEMGRCALVTQKQEGWLCGTGSLRMRPKLDLIDSEYLILLLSINGVAEFLSLMSVGSTMENLNTGILSNLPIPLPPIIEQQRIVKLIFREIEQILSGITITEREIELIKEYRTTLISDAVTGKIDVRTAIKEKMPV